MTDLERKPLQMQDETGTSRSPLSRSPLQEKVLYHVTPLHHALSEHVRNVVHKRSEILRNKVDDMKVRGRQTKAKLATEFRFAIEQVERQRKHSNVLLNQLINVIEEKEVKRRKSLVEQLHSSRVIPADAVERFKGKYEYNATCGSVLELLFFQRFWMNLSKKVPTSIMPCTITISGLLINLICCGIVMYANIAYTEIPSWTLVLCAFSMFLYQTLDALDGKQAIKLQNTHLEEIADHGSDSLSTSFVTLSVCLAMQLNPIWTTIFTLASLIAFYSTHWQTYVTNVVVFGRVDVTEAQCGMMFIHFFTAVMGPAIWKMQVFGLELRFILIVSTLCTIMTAVFRNLRIIGGAPTPLDSFAFVPRRNGIPVLCPGIPLSVWTAFAIVNGPSLATVEPCLFCVLFGILFTKMLVKLQVATLGQVDCQLWDNLVFVPLVLTVNNVFSILSPRVALVAALIVATVDLLRYVIRLTWDICDFQDIHVFTMKYPVGHPDNKAGDHGIYVNGLNNNQVIQKVKEMQLLLHEAEVDVGKPAIGD